MDIPQTIIGNKEQNHSPLPSTPTEAPIKDNREKLRKPVMFFVVVLAIVLLSFGFYIYKMRNRVSQSKNDLSIQKLDEQTKKSISEKLLIIERETKFMAFIRNGDVWIKNIDEGQEEKITSHPVLKIKQRHLYGGQWITDDYSNEFYQLPKISPDGKFLVYLGINKSIFEEIKEYEAELATESAEVKNSGNSVAFFPPGISYSWNIYDLDRKIVIEPEIDVNIKNDKEKIREIQNGPFGSMEWLNQNLIFSFISGLNSYALRIDYSQDRPPTAIIINTGNNTCGLLCGMFNGSYANDRTSFLVRSSPDGTKLLLPQGQVKDVTNPQERALIPDSCGGSVSAEETLVIDNITKKLINFSKTNLCRIYIGDWYKDNQNFIQLEHYADKSAWFVKRSVLSPSLEADKLFQDSDFFFNSPIYLSPDNRYVMYFSGKYEAENTGRRDLRIRNLTTNEYFDVLDITQKQIKLNLNRIAYPTWDANSKYVYFKISTNNNLGYAIKFNIENKEVAVLAEDVDQLNVN